MCQWSGTLAGGREELRENKQVMSYLTAEKKQELFGQYGTSNSDTGSAESQVALFSYRINHLTEHLKKNRHDFGTQRALLRLVGKRRHILEYLKEKDIERYRALIKALGLRK
jgi:small subunit ribosomal protein S15